MNSINVLLISIGLLVVGAIFSALIANYRRACGWLASLFAFFGCAGIFYVACRVFAGETVRGTYARLNVFGLAASLHLQVDKLSAIFLMVASFIAFCATLYSIRYILIPRYTEHSLLRYYPILLIFIASVVTVVSTWDMLFFIVFWELMTLASYVLVVFERGSAESLRAGLRYFITTHLATACMIFAAIIVYTKSGPERSFDFETLRGGMAALISESPGLAHLVLGLFFVGFATKAGILPFGFWLPDAYPAAPSAASAAFAGTMTKLGVYGIVRVFVWLLPISHYSTVWGEIIAVFGTISIFIAGVTALWQNDSKRVLSFQLIASVGYMLLGIGMGICFLRISPALAVVGLAAGLFHVINGACYKSLLFLNAGAALYRSGTRDLNRVGGLMTIMPLTAITAIIASLSIAGIPPFSGFSSKWLIFQGSLNGGMQLPLFLILGISAIFISAVILGCFLRFLGTLFFGKLHVEGGEVEERDVPLTMKIPQVLIAIFCILFGIFPMLAVRFVYEAVSSVVPHGYAPQPSSLFGSLPAGVNLSIAGGSVGVWNPALVVGALAICFLISYGIYHLAGAPVRKTATWLCGEEHGIDEVRYRAQGFYLPFQDFLSFRVGRRRATTYFPRIPRPRVGALAWLRKAVNFDEWLYYPLLRVGRRWCERFSETHVGIPQVYVLWMAIGTFLAIVILLALSIE